MFRHVREIIGEDVAAFLARVRDAERRASATATPGVAHEAPAQHVLPLPPNTAPSRSPRADEPAVCCEPALPTRCDPKATNHRAVITLDVINACR